MRFVDRPEIGQTVLASGHAATVPDRRDLPMHIITYRLQWARREYRFKLSHRILVIGDCDLYKQLWTDSLAHLWWIREYDVIGQTTG